MKIKMNNKGFMLTEVVVMAAIILGTLTSIYVSYSKTFLRYEEILNYYNVDGIYKLAYYRDYMIENDSINSSLNNVNTSGYKDVSSIVNSSTGSVYIFKTSSINSLIENAPNVAYKEYLTYLTKAVSFESEYVMTLEYSIDGDDRTYYSYLELEV